MLSPTSIAFYGKLPWTGDFITRNMDFSQCQLVDQWLSAGMAALQDADTNWLESYLSAPVWSFCVPAGVWAEPAVCGALMPSVDRVGRYFPFLLFWPVDAGIYQQQFVHLTRAMPVLLEQHILPDEITSFIAQSVNAQAPGYVPEVGAISLITGEGAGVAGLDDPLVPGYYARREGLCHWWNEDTGFSVDTEPNASAFAMAQLFGKAGFGY